jgi:hypothetical protein
VALLVPDDFDMESLESEAEQRVVRALVAGLSDEWLVVPRVPVLAGGQNAELDVVLVSPHSGVVLVETKGGVISVRGGQWYAYDTALKRSPFEQVARAKHGLLKRLHSAGLDLNGLYIQEVVAMPDVGDIPPEGIGPGAPRHHCWGHLDLEHPAVAIARLAKDGGPISHVIVSRLIHFLLPDVDLKEIDGHYIRGAASRLDANTRERLDAAIGLDQNSRFLLLGGAGTGKTTIVRQWAHRACLRKERTLLVCFNRPLADDLAHSLRHTNVVVDSFHGLLWSLTSPLGLQMPANPSPEWWNGELIDFFLANEDHFATRYDTVLVDEGQDFRPEWFGILERRLAPEGPRRFLVAADPKQAIYVPQWQAPADLPRLELRLNLRNSRSIAQKVAEMGGAPVNPLSPKGPKVESLTADRTDLPGVVKKLLTGLQRDLGIIPSQMAVLTRHRDLQQLLIANSDADLSLVEWKDRVEGSVLCETIHRAKGIERQAIIICDLDDAADPQLHYIGYSRPTLFLATIGRATA